MQARLESLLMHVWMRRGPLACLLWPFSLLFAGLSAQRRRRYVQGRLPSTRMPVPVVVVGNVFVGGTGKTPLVIWLAQALRQVGYVPGVVSRGHGAAADAPRMVDENAAPEAVGDEPLLIAMRAGCPVMVARNRVAAAQALLQAHPEINVLISDDGLQHYALQRDIEVVLFDERGIGNGWQLPAGPLREPAGRRRDFTVLNTLQPIPDMPIGTFRMQLDGTMAHRLDGVKSVPLATLPRVVAATSDRPHIVAAAGIGNPARFFALLHGAGINCTEMPLPDHFDFSFNPFAGMNADAILITEKDAVKCRHIPALKYDPRLWVVPVDAQLDSAFLEQILEKLRGQSIA